MSNLFYKLIPIILIQFMQVFSLDAQTIHPRNMLVELSYGYPNVGLQMTKYFKYSSVSYDIHGFGPIMFKFEFVASPKLGIGFQLHRTSYRGEFWDDSSSHYKIKGRVFGAYFKLQYHLINEDGVDVYMGFHLGYRNSLHIDTSYPPSEEEGGCVYLIPPLPLGAYVCVGTRYFITRSLAFNAEIGVGSSFVSGGISYLINPKKINE